MIWPNRGNDRAARQYDRAISQFRAVADTEPQFARVHMVALAYTQQGRFDEAIADLDSSQQDLEGFWAWNMRAYVCGRAGHRAEAKHAVGELMRLDRHGAIDPIVFVAPSIGMNDRDQAFAWLEKSVAAHSPGLTALKVDPIYDPLRSDPRYQDLLRRVGLAQ